jgi:hypothetical protein
MHRGSFTARAQPGGNASRFSPYPPPDARIRRLEAIVTVACLHLNIDEAMFGVHEVRKHSDTMIN